MTRPAINFKFELLLKLLGKEKGRNMGQWRMDFCSHYGGYIIVEVMNDAGGISYPLVQRRLKNAEMQAALDMAIELKRGESHGQI